MASAPTAMLNKDPPILIPAIFLPRELPLDSKLWETIPPRVSHPGNYMDTSAIQLAINNYKAETSAIQLAINNSKAGTPSYPGSLFVDLFFPVSQPPMSAELQRNHAAQKTEIESLRMA